MEKQTESTPIGLWTCSTVQENLQDRLHQKTPYLKVLSDRLVIYQLSEVSIRNKVIHANSLTNLSKKEYSGKLSPTTASKIRTILDTWLSAIIQHIKDKNNNYDKNDYYPVFITLTLCSKQKHTDKECNRKMLSQFLEKYKYHTGSKHIFWRAETQKNQNIHYHIIADKYLAYDRIRKMWNDIQETNGYIDEFEKKWKNRNPNSTDVKGVKDVKDFVKYVLKYCTKSEGNRVIEARIWGMTDELRELKPCVIDISSIEANEIGKILQTQGTRHIKSEFVDIVCFRQKNIVKPCNMAIFKAYKQHLRDSYTLLYTLPALSLMRDTSIKELVGDILPKKEPFQMLLYSSKVMKAIEIESSIQQYSFD